MGACDMKPDDHRLPPAYRLLATAPGWDTGTHVSDEYGRVGFRADHRSLGPLLVAAKNADHPSGLHRGHIGSFMPKLVSVGLIDGRDLALVCVDAPRLHEDVWLFDPARVSNRGGRRVLRRSKRAENVRVFDVSVEDHAARCGDVLAGRAAVPRAGGAEDGQRGLAAFGGDPA